MLKQIVTIIIIATVIITLACWRDRDLMDQWIGSPYETVTFREWHRLITSGFLHANPLHLILNMYALFSISRLFLGGLYDNHPFKKVLFFLLCYLGGIFTANVFTVIRHRKDEGYRHLGASAGVSAIVLSVIWVFPMEKISFFHIVSMPGFLYAVLYLSISFFLRDRGNIGHFVHFIGGVFGLLFTIALFPSTLWDNVERVKDAFSDVFQS